MPRIQHGDEMHSGTGGGVPDHGALTGLADDDHTNLLNEARHDALDHTGLTGVGGGSHPDLATHDTLGLATDAELSAHAAATDPHTAYVLESDANWIDLTDGGASTLHSHAGGGTHPDLTTHDSLGLATDAELASHAGDTGLHGGGGAHPNLSAHDTLGLATDAELASHVAAADPHTGYQLEAEKGAASGYAGLGAGGLVPMAQLATGTPNGTKFVRDDGTLVVPSGGGMSNPMTTVGDVIKGGTAGAAERLAIGTAGQVLKVVSGAPAWAAESGGGGGGGWTQEVNESGASFANFTIGSGTWTSDGTIITGNNVTGAFRRARHNTKPVIGAGIVYEAELRFPTSGQGTGTDVVGGLLIGTDAVDAGSLSIRLDRGASRIKVERDGLELTGEFLSLTVNLDTWYKLRAVVAGPWVTIYYDGTKLGSRRVSLSNSSDYVGLLTYNAKVDFRNIKCWSRSGDLPA